MLCVLAARGRGRYSGGVERPPGPDGGPPAEVEVEVARRPRPAGAGDVYDVDITVYRFDGMTADGEPRYVRDRDYTAERTG